MELAEGTDGSADGILTNYNTPSILYNELFFLIISEQALLLNFSKL